MPSETPALFDFSQLTLDTPRLHLRPLRPGDAPVLFDWHADPVVMRHWSTPPWTDPALADALVARDQAAMAAGESIRLGLQRRSDGRLVGACSLFAFHLASRRAEIGYMLAHDCWGGGLMHEALGALLGYGFGVLGLNRVEADIDPRNGGSRKVLERQGFRLEGVLRERWFVDGEVSDTGLYGLLRRDWTGQLPDTGVPGASGAAGPQRR